MQATAQEPPLTVYAAGSLRAALTLIARDFEATPGGGKVTFVFGASGLLRERLQGGERADLFASANMEHPQALADAGRAEPVTRFARNALCLLAAPGFEMRGQSLAARLLDPTLKLGISTPKADPSGDYAFELFERFESIGAAGPGVSARLKAQALQLTGGPASPPPPSDRNVYGAMVAAGQADVFITYCTNAELARKEEPALRVLSIPAALNVAASYGQVVLRPVSAGAQRFAHYLLGAAAQQRLASFGFSAP